MATATMAGLTQLEAQVADILDRPPELSGFYSSLKAFLAAEFDEPEELLAGLHRGEVALLVSDEAQSKTRLLMQMALALTGGQAALPWSPEDKTPRRVVYVNGDAAASRLRGELQPMMSQISDTNAVQKNFLLLADTRINRQPLNLHREAHWQMFRSFLKTQPADLVIIDGAREPLTPAGRISAAAQLQLLRKARQLAGELDCAILVATTSASRKRLSGTALAHIADTIYALTSDQRRGDDYRQWRCPKSRWRLPDTLDLQRDDGGGGYRIFEAESNATSSKPTREDVVEFVRARQSAHTAEIVQAFADRAAPRTLAYLLNEAKLLGWLTKERRDAPWQLGKRALEQSALHAEPCVDEITETCSDAGQVVDELRHNRTDADDFADALLVVADELLSVAPSGGSLEIVTLPPEGATPNTGTNSARKQKGRKQGNKRHNKKMRRCR